jgi:streptogramin lyase
MCSQLFSAATPSGGTQPTDVASAMLLIAQNPGNNVPTLFSYSTTNAAFQPALGTAPNDLTLGITYTGGGLTAPGSVVIDAAGDAFTANCPSCNGGTGASSIVGFSPVGAVLTGTSGFNSGGVVRPQGLAIDQEGYVWVADNGAPAVFRFNSSGANAPGFPVTASSPTGIAVDGNSNAWVTGGPTGLVYEVTNLGVKQNTNNSFTAPFGIGIDGYGYIFVADQAASDIARLSNTGSSLATFNQGGISGPISIAIDHTDQVWTVDNTTNNISKVGGINGGPAAGSPYPGGYQFAVLAIAGDGSVWFANCKAGCPGSGAPTGQPDNIIHVSSAGAYLTSTNGYQDTHFNGVGTAAIDKSGNLWVSNSAGGSLTELLGVAAPVVTPLATGSQYNALGIRP